MLKNGHVFVLIKTLLTMHKLYRSSWINKAELIEKLIKTHRPQEEEIELKKLS